MPRLLAHTETALMPDDSQLYVVSGEPPNPHTRWAEGQIVSCAQDVVVLESGSEFPHEPTIRLEVWDGEPPPPAGDWDASQDGRVELTEETVAVQALYEEDVSERIRVGEPGWYEIRAFVAGREALARWEREWTGEEDEGDAVGLERFVVQFWPATDRAPDPS